MVAMARSVFWWVVLSGLLVSVAAAAEPFYSTVYPRQPSVGELTALGRRLFREPALSASGQQSCASCHSPEHRFGPPNALSVQVGGADGAHSGVRAVPSLMYRQFTPPFTEHFADNDGNDSEDQGPAGGYTWDGRATSVHEQAALPLLSPLEMANASTQAVLRRLAASPAAPAFRQAFGASVFESDAMAWNGLLWALEVYQQDPVEFAPFSSKFDAYLRGQARLSAAEQRGLAVFNDPRRGNCMQCHPSVAKRGAFPLFTDDGYVALGVPRNPVIAANRDTAWFDLGLCGPLRSDLRRQARYCGLFKTPSLRNVADRPVFFHNGVYRQLSDVLRFYAERDARPQRIYPHDGQGRLQRFDDLPATYRANVYRDPPFGHRAGLSQNEQDDLLAFLRTLSDGYAAVAPVR